MTGNQFLRCACGIAQHTVGELDHHPDQVDISPLIEAANIVGIAIASLVKDPAMAQA